MEEDEWALFNEPPLEVTNERDKEEYEKFRPASDDSEGDEEI